MEDALATSVRRVLTHLRNPRRPSDGLLESWPGLGSPQAVHTFVRTEIASLADSPSPIDQEAAEILRLYYLGRSTGHDVTAHRVHLSRATYFRRLDYGIRCLAEAVRALGVVEG